MKIPARCNKRTCQARRNLSKHPQEYRSHPRCHLPGCDGEMYVDVTRLQGRDTACRLETCHDDCLPYPHRKGDGNCKHSMDWLIENSLKPVSKHSPKKTEEMF